MTRLDRFTVTCGQEFPREGLYNLFVKLWWSSPGAPGAPSLNTKRLSGWKQSDNFYLQFATPFTRQWRRKLES